MREILFKAKRVDNGEWVEGNLIISHRNHVDKNFKCVEYYILNDDYLNGEFIGFKIKVIPKTVSQFTGLTDKNGVKIFENDIVEHIEEFDRETEFGEIRRWTENKRYIVIYDLEEADYKATNGEKEYKGNYTYLGQYKKEEDNVEIIGNIFDNPELLEASND